MASTDPTNSTITPLGTLYQHLKELEFDLAELRGRYTEDHPDVRMKLRQVETVRLQIQREVQRQSDAHR